MPLEHSHATAVLARTLHCERQRTAELARRVRRAHASSEPTRAPRLARGLLSRLRTLLATLTRGRLRTASGGAASGGRDGTR